MPKHATLTAAVRAAKIDADLDPDVKYPPAQWVDFLEPEWRRPFWDAQIERAVLDMTIDAECAGKGVDTPKLRDAILAMGFHL